MRYQRSLLPTLKEAPADATTASHVLLSRAGFVRRVGAGIYAFLPLGVRVLRKLEAIIREEMNRSGAEEVLLPALAPAEYLRESGRWDTFGETLFRLKDRRQGDYLLGPTHEELITELARRELESYRDLPKTLFQIQTKFRDEPRPRAGLLRCREFTMKDAYSFLVTAWSTPTRARWAVSLARSSRLSCRAARTCCARAISVSTPQTGRSRARARRSTVACRRRSRPSSACIRPARAASSRSPRSSGSRRIGS